MQHKPLTLSEANLLIQPLIGMPVSLAWKGYGSAVFLELGLLAPADSSRQRSMGEAGITIEWDWRIEEGATVKYGSSNNRPTIKRGIESLHGVLIETIAIRGQVPELFIQFSNNQRLMTAVMITGDPEWSIRLADENWITCADGIVFVGDGSWTKPTSVETRAITHAESTAKRWGKPGAEPIEGSCDNCHWFVRIDGDFSLLDFGVCTSSASPFDGKVVNIASGCDMFINDET